VHVAFFNRSYAPEATATARLLTELCDDLVRDHGCRVTAIVGPVLGDPEAAPRTSSGVTVRRVRGTRFDKSRFAGRATNYLSYFAAATWAGLRLDRPDVIVALTDPPIVGLSAWISGKRHRAPFVIAFKDLFPEVAALLPDFHSDAINGVLQHVNRFLVARAAANVALGAAMRQRLIDDKGAPPDRTLIIEDWADTSTIIPKPKRNAFSERHGLADAFVVMHSGNLGLAQNLDTLVDAAGLLKDLRDVRVVFVGDGVKKAELERRVREAQLTNVVFLPFTPAEELADAFATADVFVVSLQRGFAGYIVPSKLYGILAAGRPYVAAVEDGCEVAALTRAHATGLVADPGDAHALAAQIRTFYQDRSLAQRCGTNGRALGLSFDRTGQVAKYMELFRRLAPGAGPS
jgi:colanic acid biosynthesis glycosyl transferase WcaI